MGAPEASLDTIIRLGKATDVAYVVRNFIHGCQGALVTRRLHGDEYRGRVREQIIGLLERPAARLFVACDSEDEDVILGFALVERSCVHWVYVRADWRHQGIARALLGAHTQPLDTFSVWVAGIDAAKVPESWAYDPFAAVWPHWAETQPRRDQTKRRHKARGASAKETVT